MLCLWCQCALNDYVVCLWCQCALDDHIVCLWYQCALDDYVVCLWYQCALDDYVVCLWYQCALDDYVVSVTDKSQFRAVMYDITQYIMFKRGVAALVLANCSLLAVPVSPRLVHCLL